MKTFLKELIEVVEDIKPKVKCSYSPFEEKRCKTCHKYKECLDIDKHQQRCNDLLNKLKVKEIFLYQ